MEIWKEFSESSAACPVTITINTLDIVTRVEASRGLGGYGKECPQAECLGIYLLRGTGLTPDTIRFTSQLSDNLIL